MRIDRPNARGWKPRKVLGTAICLSILSVLLPAFPVPAAINVDVSGPGGKTLQAVSDAGGAFDLSIPLNGNAVNKIVVTAVDRYGNTASKEISVTQLSMQSIVVSKVTTQRLSVQEVKQLVNEGVINLANPENFNVSKFDVVLTIGQERVPVSIPIAVGKEVPEPMGEEVYKFPRGNGWNNRSKNQPPVEIVIFDKPVISPALPEPLSIPGVIIIEGNIKSLKEFYSVRLLLMNTSGIFTLKNVSANIEFPDGGLSNVLPADGVASFGDILPGNGDQPGQKEKEFIVRGDEIGVRGVRLNFGGSLAGPGLPENDPIRFNGSANSGVEVKGPPAFKVRVTHPDFVITDIPYELKVDITNIGELPALYASLALDVGADARLVKCRVDNNYPDNPVPVCEPIEGADVRNFGDILPGQTVSETFTVNPLMTGTITSCVGASDQNITLQVLVGTIGCVVGKFPPDRGAPGGAPTVSVVPGPNMAGVGIDTPVTAFFSTEMERSTITTGEGGTFTVTDSAGRQIPGSIRFSDLGSGPEKRTVAIWQVSDGLTNRLQESTEFTVWIRKDVRDFAGNFLASDWTSRFTTTSMGVNDFDPPTLTLSVDPPVNPNYVLPGQIVKVDAYASDMGSGVARVELRLKDLDVQGAAFKLVDQKTVFAGNMPPYIFAIDSANLERGRMYQVLGTAYDGMGNAQNSTISLYIAPTADPPTLSLQASPAGDVLRGTSLMFNPTVTGGVREVRYYLDGAAVPFKTVNLAPYQGGLGTLDLVEGLHSVRVVAEDALGQTGEAAYSFNVLANGNAPTVGFGGAVSGSWVLQGSSITITGTAADPLGIASVRYYLDGLNNPIPGAGGTQPFTLDTSGLSVGEHTVYIVAENNLQVTNSASLQFTVVTTPAGSPPDAPAISSVSVPQGGQTTVRGTSVGGARVDITNTGAGISLSVTVSQGGSYLAVLPASPGDLLRAVAYNLSQSLSPSPAATAVVPAPPVLDYIDVSPVSMTFSSANAYADIRVTAYYQGGAPSADMTANSTYSSSAPSVASVNASGRVAAIGNGNALITVGAEGQTFEIPVTVNIPTLNSISVTPTSVDFNDIGQARQLAVTGNYSDGSSTVLSYGNTFVTGNPAVAAVNGSGLITSAGGGSTQVTVIRQGVAPVSVEVRVNILASITVSPPSVALEYLTQTRQLAVTGYYGDGSTALLSEGNAFLSADSAVVSVSGSGLVSAVGNGITQITVSRPGVSSVIVPVTVDTSNDPAPTVEILGPANGA
ncbi:MAG: Ig-like domain-containing protein, partial [Deltaproteobacteria bacterium]|nr:Ig-like domain-containing protein [Deltaproteobacteria bacterium]